MIFSPQLYYTFLQGPDMYLTICTRSMHWTLYSIYHRERAVMWTNYLVNFQNTLPCLASSTMYHVLCFNGALITLLISTFCVVDFVSLKIILCIICTAKLQ